MLRKCSQCPDNPAWATAQETCPLSAHPEARQMFEGEVASLEAFWSTGLVQALRPMKVIILPRGGATFVMEHLKMSLSRGCHRDQLCREALMPLHRRTPDQAPWPPMS
nr:uncharacterized protein LOC105498517 isoform X2 [Macaca nemestrina]